MKTLIISSRSSMPASTRSTPLVFVRTAAFTAILTLLLSALPAVALALTGTYPSVRFMRDAPNDNAVVIKNVPAGVRLTVEPVTGTDYAKTTYNGTTGYVKHLKFQREYLPGEAPSDASSGAAPKYYLFANKAANSLTVYLTDASGRRTDQVVKRFTIGIGKRSTPTPVGRFKLGGKEQWHFFGKSYAPFAIKYASGKYLHGPLYRSKDTSTLISSSLSGVGDDVTGGCLRMRYDDMKWIYDNCMSGTTLEIVNGE